MQNKDANCKVLIKNLYGFEKEIVQFWVKIALNLCCELKLPINK